MVAFAMGLVAGGVACDELSESPGADFRVELASPLQVWAVGAIQVPVRLRVTGCAAFLPELQSTSGTHALHTEPEGGNVHRADVPVAWVRGNADATLCRAVFDPGPIVDTSVIEVTCLDDGRKQVVGVEFVYRVATRATWLGSGGAARFLIPGSDPLVPYAVLPDWLRAYAVVQPSVVPVPYWVDDEDPTWLGFFEPRGVASTDSLYLTSGCFVGWDCPEIQLPGGAAPGEQLSGIGNPGGGPGETRLWEPVWVPQRVVDLAFTSSGDVVVLSQDLAFPGGRVVVTRVVPGPLPTVELVAELPREVARGGLAPTQDGKLAFLAYRVPATDGVALTSVLHRTDGVTLESAADVTGDVDLGTAYSGEAIFPNSASLAPDGSAIAVLDTYDAVYVGAPGGERWQRLPFEPLGSSAGGVAWGDRAFAVWEGARVGSSGGGRLAVFERAPPHALRFPERIDPLPFDTGPRPQLYGVLVIGDRVVLSLSTGVRVLDLDGNIVGGAEPWPCHLGTATPAIQAGPSHFAIAAGENVYVFDLSHP